MKRLFLKDRWRLMSSFELFLIQIRLTSEPDLRMRNDKLQGYLVENGGAYVPAQRSRIYLDGELDGVFEKQVKINLYHPDGNTPYGYVRVKAWAGCWYYCYEDLSSLSDAIVTQGFKMD